MSSFTRVA